MDVYNLETITALAFHLGTYGAEQIRQALLDRIMHGKRENGSLRFAVHGEEIRQPLASVMNINKQAYHHANKLICLTD